MPSSVGAVEARLPGVSAAELERVLTAPIEDAMLRLPAVVDTWAETRDGLVLVMVECEGGAAVSGSAWTSIEDRLGRLADELREGFVGLSGPLLHRPTDEWAEALVSVRGPAGGGAPPVESAQRLADALTSAESVGWVELVGRPREQIVLTYEDAELVSAGITPLEFREYLRAQHVLGPGAYLQHGGRILPVETVSRIRDFESLEQLPVRDPDDGDPVSMSRLLDVSREEIAPTVERVLADGEVSVVLAVHRAAGAHQAAFAADVRAAVAAHDARVDVSCDLVVFQPEVVDQEFERFGQNLGQGFALILILLVVTLGLRVGLSVAIVLPFVVLTTFIVMHAAGLGLNVVSLASFILVLGLLVDNHIVMAERIRRLTESGVARLDAIRQASRELLGPLSAAAATTALGFLPVVLTDDPIGHYVSALFWVVLVSLAVSLVFCFVVTPRLQPTGSPMREGVSAFERRYRAILARCMGRPALLALVVLALCFGGWLLLQSRAQIFFPASERPLWLLEVEREVGVEVEGTQDVTADLERLLAAERANDGGALHHAVTFVGRSAPRVQATIPYREFAPHYAQVLLKLDPEGDVAGFEARLRAWMPENEPRARLRLRRVQLGAPIEWPVQFEVRGAGSATHEVAEILAERLLAAGCVNVSTDWGEPIAKLSIEPDRAALAERDLTVGDVTIGMHSVIHGLPLFDLLEGGERTPVMLRAAVRRPDTREALADAYVYPRKGDAALLYEVAEIRDVEAHPVRARRRGVPAVTVRGETPDPDLALTVEMEVDRTLQDLRSEHPLLSIRATGVSSSAARADRAMLEQVPWALLAILLCLLLQSGSFLETALILLTVPMSLAGVGFGLALLGEPFSFMSLVGMTALAGIVVNNAIVLLSSIRRNIRQSGVYRREILIESAGHRLRPILLTALCALASMVVLWVSGGPMWHPLATTVISGLAFATLLVLLVLPVLFGWVLERSEPARK